MCGIAGIISPHPALVRQHTLEAMAKVLAHRGPNGEGFWINNGGNIGFAHRRLRIIDLHERASQPLHYLHYTVIFNGEIYNYLELKDMLRYKGYAFATECDTEIIPAAFDCWGADCLHHFDGMFAFALWDERRQELILARDRFAEKPLYYHADYAQRGKFERFIFASEMKALWVAGAAKHLNGTMVLNYLTLGYVHDPTKKTATFYNDILSLPQGHYLTVQPQLGRVQMKRWYGGGASGERPMVNVEGEKKTTTAKQPSVNGNHQPAIISEQEAAEQFASLLATSVKRRLRSDVKIGTCLSGGIDSSSIVAVCNGLKAPHLTHECFTAVFPGFEKDEHLFAKKVSEHFCLRQHTIEVTADDWIKNFETVAYHQEEPMQSSSVLAQFMVYGLAKQNDITVLLDGQGADETLGGYKKYSAWYLRQLLRTNFAAFRKEKQLLRENLFLEGWGPADYAAAFFPAKAAEYLQQKAANQQVRDKNIDLGFLRKYQNVHTLQKPVVRNMEDILYHNTLNHGLPELLRYADRNSMAHGREARLPFLYHELVEFVFSLPAGYKIRNGFTKWVLRQSMVEKLPAEIIWRKDKIGFEPPQQQWMRQPAIKLMIMEARKKLAEQGILNSALLKKPATASNAHDKHSSDWRYLCAASLL